MRNDYQSVVTTKLKPALGKLRPTDEAGRHPVRRDSMGKRFGQLAAELGHGYTLYGLRHFMASQLGAVAAAGTVRDRMGHGSLAVTSGYMHPVSEADRQAARYMGDLLDGRAAWRSPEVRAVREGETAGTDRADL